MFWLPLDASAVLPLPNAAARFRVPVAVALVDSPNANPKLPKPLAVADASAPIATAMACPAELQLDDPTEKLPAGPDAQALGAALAVAGVAAVAAANAANTPAPVRAGPIHQARLVIR